MDFSELQTLVNKGEGNRIEFKLSTGQISRAMETGCAMLNGNGGFVIFGVDDKGVIKGQKVSDKTKKILAEQLKKFEPSFFF